MAESPKRRPGDFSQVARQIVQEATGTSDDLPDLDLMVDRFGRTNEQRDEARARIVDARRRANAGQFRDNADYAREKLAEERRRLAAR